MPAVDRGPESHATVVIGVGSPLMGDDGLGLHALEVLRGIAFDPHVGMLDGGTWGMNLLPFLERADRVLVLDAIDAGREPGEVVVLEGEAIPRFLSTKLSPHQIDLKEVLALAELRGTLPELVAAGLQPGRVEMSSDLGEDVERGLPALVDEAIRRLALWGHERADVPCTR